MNKNLETLLNHASVRDFQDKPVSEQQLDLIIKAIQSAPNWVNLQHVSVIAIKDKARKSLFSRLCGNQKPVEQAAVFLVFCADFYRTELACQKHGQSMVNVLKDPDFLLVGAHEVGIAIEAAVVAAESMGLGTVPIGDVRLHPMEIIKELALPKFVLPLLGLCIGYAATSPLPRPRLPKETVFFEEKYQTEYIGELLDGYDQAYREYLEKRPWFGRTGTWSDIAAGFYREPYNHYPQVPDMLGTQGFKNPRT